MPKHLLNNLQTNRILPLKYNSNLPPLQYEVIYKYYSVEYVPFVNWKQK